MLPADDIPSLFGVYAGLLISFTAFVGIFCLPGWDLAIPPRPKRYAGKACIEPILWTSGGGEL
ncbi:TPA: hypothetical protein EYP37_10610 [Candidatus Poribacteria bacterium]|nr:hypothetical protein [Candidatus Poribacteria bacterium]